MKYLLMSLLVAAMACGTNEQPTTGGDTNTIDPTDSSTIKREEPNVTQDTLTSAEMLALPQVPILCYHRIQPVAKDEYSVTPARFEEQMQVLKDSGYHSILPEDLYNYMMYKKPLPDKPVMITFDDTRVEHYAIAKPVMEKRGLKGVFFIMTIAIGKKNYMSREQIRSLDSSGHSIGSHTWDHHMVTKYTPEDWEIQLKGSQKTLTEITGKPIEYFAYPFGIWNSNAAAYLKETNIKLAFILSTSRDSNYVRQGVRRMIVPYQWSAPGMLKAMKSTFSRG